MCEKDLTDWVKYQSQKKSDRQRIKEEVIKKEEAEATATRASKHIKELQSKYGWRISPYQGRVSPEDLQKRKNQGRCMKCGEKGHQKAACPEIYYQMEKKQDKRKRPGQPTSTPKPKPGFLCPLI
jgi:hypothetical protein